MLNRLSGQETTMKLIQRLVWLLSVVQNVQTMVLKEEGIELLTTVKLNNSISIIQSNIHKIGNRKAYNLSLKTIEQYRPTQIIVNNPPFDNKTLYTPGINRSCTILPNTRCNTTINNPPVVNAKNVSNPSADNCTKEFTKNPFTLSQEEDPNIMGKENKSSSSQPSAWRGGGRGGRSRGRGRQG